MKIITTTVATITILYIVVGTILGSQDNAQYLISPEPESLAQLPSSGQEAPALDTHPTGELTSPETGSVDVDAGQQYRYEAHDDDETTEKAMQGDEVTADFVGLDGQQHLWTVRLESAHPVEDIAYPEWMDEPQPNPQGTPYEVLVAVTNNGSEPEWFEPAMVQLVDRQENTYSNDYALTTARNLHTDILEPIQPGQTRQVSVVFEVMLGNIPHEVAIVKAYTNDVVTTIGITAIGELRTHVVEEN